MAFWDSFFGDKSKSTSAKPDFVQVPEFPEAQGARQLLWKNLQDWGSQPDYGAVPQDWADIWSMAQQRVRDVYRGTPTQPGALDRVKASAARRGVSESPSMEANISALGASEGQDLMELARNQAIAEAQFSESGRQNWINSLQGLTSLTPQGTWHTPWSQTVNTPSPWQVIQDVAKMGATAMSGIPGGG